MTSITGLLPTLQNTANIYEPLRALASNTEKHSSHGLFLCVLDEHRFIRASGPDAQKFLQGQCTCDFTALSPGQSTRGAHCNPKGRIITGFVAVKLSEEEFILRVHHSIADSALAALKKYAVFSKLDLELDKTLQSFALIGDEANDHAQALLEGGMLVAYHHDAANITECWFSELQSPESALATALQALPALCISDVKLWQALQIQCGYVEIRADEQEQFLPQELNYPALNAVSFKKGCYTGQEVIARLHYKGKLKKGLYRGRVSKAEIEANTKIVDSEGAKLGSVIQWTKSAAETSEFLALVDHSTIDEQVIAHCQDSSEKIEWLPFAYAIPKGE